MRSKSRPSKTPPSHGLTGLAAIESVAKPAAALGGACRLALAPLRPGAPDSMPVKTIHFLRPFHGECLRFKVFFCAIGNEFLVADAIARLGKAAILFSELRQPLVRSLDRKSVV